MSRIRFSRNLLFNIPNWQRYCSTSSNRQHVYRVRDWDFLYTSGSEATSGSPVQPDLFIDNLDHVAMTSVRADMIFRRWESFDDSSLITALEQYRTIRDQKRSVEKERDEVASHIAEIAKDKTKGKPNIPKDLVERGKTAKKELKTLMPDFYCREMAVVNTVLSLPCPLHTDTRQNPEGAIIYEDLRAGKEIDQPCDASKQEWEELMHSSDVSPGAVYLRGSLALLERKVWRAFSRLLLRRGWSAWSAPDFVKPVVMEGCGYDVTDRTQHLGLERRKDEQTSQQLFFCGGADLAAFAAYFTKHIIKDTSLPIKWHTTSSAYSPEHLKEGGSALLRSPQRKRVAAMACVVDGGEGERVVEELRDILVTAYSALQLPFRLSLAPASSLARNEGKQLSCEVAGDDGTFVKVGWISDHGDYVSRRLMIKTSHSLNDTRSRHYPTVVSCCVADVLPLLSVLRSRPLAQVEECLRRLDSLS